MSVRRLVQFGVVACLAASIAPLPAAGAASGAPARASKHGKKARCKKGYKPVTVNKHGHKVRKCVKKKKPTPTPPSPPCRTAATSCALPAPLFDPPGKKLEGNDAVPFLEKYLADSTFTDCVPGWPNCPGGTEERYSHGPTPGNAFSFCYFTSSSGSDRTDPNDEYGLKGAQVEADGSWAVRETIGDYGHYPEYLWTVSTGGVVEGEYFYPGEPAKHIGPLTYLGYAKLGCSY